MKNEMIDIVLTWVDYNDPIWQAEYNKYAPEAYKSNEYVGGKTRYSAHKTLKYLFRGIEKYANWVHKVYFVTFGHIPTWLNINYDKLVVVKHSDFIPCEYLPTFNSNTILLNLHRIEGLSEHFILFNDDMYFTNYCKETDFFKKGLPRDMAIENSVFAPDFDPFWDMMLNNMCLINKYFDKKGVISGHPLKWFNIRYGLKNNVRNICHLPYKKFSGFYDCHLPNAHLKSCFNEVWDKAFCVCHNTCLNKFRSADDITEWTVKYWQLVSNKFIPINKSKLGFYVSLSNEKYKKVFNSNYKKKLICLNDESENMEFVASIFESRLPNKSLFEK